MERSRISEWHREGDIGVLTLSNPPQNYLDDPEFVELADLRRWTEDDSLKGIILTGRGRHFCAGFKREEILKITERNVLHASLKKSEKILFHLEDLPVPVVAAVTGVCFGAGLELALSCDIRVCGDKSLLSFPETEFGIIPGFNGTIRLPKRIGMSRAMEMILTARTLHADEAHAAGLVDYVVPAKEVLEYARKLLDKLTGNTSPKIVHAVMKAVNNSRKLPRDLASRAETELVAELVLERVNGSAA